MFLACGLNYKTAPLTVREKVAIPAATLDDCLRRLVALPTVNEAAILSTCNRTEIYCDTEHPHDVIHWLADEHQLDIDTLTPHLYIHQGEQGIRHVLRVASGLDSMMLGEPQILGQMKQTYHHACTLGAAKQHLNSIFQYVFNASKRVRTQSGVGNNPVSIAFAAAQLIGRFFPDIAALNVFLIGSGETAALVAKYLHQQGVKHFMVASRSHDHAQNLAATFNGEALSITDIPNYLAKADVVISATACPLPFINKSMVEHALTQRAHAPMFFLDLAVPRDIEANVGELAAVQLYNVDDLHRQIDKGMDERRTAAILAEQLIDTELGHYIRKHRSRRANTLICDYRYQMQTLAQHELKRAQQKLSAGQCQYSVLEEFSQRLIKKLTHNPTVGLRQVARDNRVELLDLAQYLLNISVETTPHEEIT